MILTTRHSGKGKIMETVKKISGCQELVLGEGINRWSTEDLEDSENTL